MKQIHQEIAAVDRGAAKPSRVWEFVPDGRGGFDRWLADAEKVRQTRADADAASAWGGRADGCS